MHNLLTLLRKLLMLPRNLLLLVGNLPNIPFQWMLNALQVQNQPVATRYVVG